MQDKIDVKFPKSLNFKSIFFVKRSLRLFKLKRTLLAFFLILASSSRHAEASIVKDICHIIETKKSWPALDHPIDRAIARLYVLRDCRPYFHLKGKLLKKGYITARILGQSRQRGLLPSRYQYGSIYRRIKGPFKGQKAQLDILLTKALVRYILDLSIGVKETTMLDQGAFPRVRHILQKVLESYDIERDIERHALGHRFYARLLRGAQIYDAAIKKVAKDPRGFYEIKEGEPFLREKVEKRLRLFSDLKGPSDPKKWQAALKRFQKRHGLKEDGRPCKKTLRELNVHPRQRFQTIAINLERWRRLGGSPGGDDVVINLAAYHLSIYEKRRPVTSMKVVIGKNHKKTPQMVAKISLLALNPYWHIPASLVKSDIIPEILKNPSYLQKKGIKVYEHWQKNPKILNLKRHEWLALKTNSNPISLRLTQKPGPQNPLGRIKFEMPDTGGIYLHDTPFRGQFRFKKRNFSQGCLRLEDPVRLALHLLKREGLFYSGAHLLKKIKEGPTIRWQLKKPMPVYITYQTAWADKNGLVYFAKDNYGRDQEEKKYFDFSSTSVLLGH